MDQITLKKLHGVLDKSSYPAFVKALGSAVKDKKVQYLLKYGLKDGDLKDDKVPFTIKYIPVHTLRPTQNEIDIDKSLKWPLSGKGNISDMLSGGNVKLGDNIITLNSLYVLDGHHRWSQAYCINPYCKIAALDFSKSGFKWQDGLKSLQLAIAAQTGDVPSASVQGKNLFSIGKTQLIDYVISEITDHVAQLIAISKLGLDVTATIEEMKITAAEYIWENVDVFKKNSTPPSGAPGRNIMPQTDDASGFQDKLRTGIINIADPLYSENIVRDWQNKVNRILGDLIGG